MSILAVVGLKREGALIRTPNVVPVAGGGDGTALRAKLEACLIKERPAAVVSVGLGGALSPALQVGDWVVADRVLHGPGAAVPSNALTVQLRSLLQKAFREGHVHIGAIAASEVMLVDAASKLALHTLTGALAVDMESHIAGQFAAAHGLPFAALRVISDGADRALPKAAQAGMKKDGGMDILAVLRELATDPRQLPALIRTGREAKVAFQKLKLLGRDDLLGRLGVGDPDLGQLPLDVV